jgi:CheY-like chemotaxis protein
MRKVLVGESIYAEFEVLNDYLTGKGFSVQWVKNGADAVAMFGRDQPDLVILDALLPGIPGLKVCQQIRKLPGGERAKTILLSKVYKQFRAQYESRKTMGVDAYGAKPVDVAELDKSITELLGELPPAPPAPPPTDAPESGEPRRSLGTAGSLADAPFPRLLFTLHKYRRTGALRIAHEQISKVIYLRGGNPVFVTSNLSNETLGRYLVQRGVITDEQYNSSLEIMVLQGKQQVYEALQGQTREKILRVFAWDDGEYEFRAGAFAVDEAVQVETPTLPLLLEGVRRFYSLSRLERYFNEYKNQRLRRLKGSLLDKGALVLAPHEAKFARLIDGRTTLGKLVARSHLSLSETFQLLYFLLLVETVRFVGDPGFARRGAREQEAFLAEKRERYDDLRQLHEDREGYIDERRKRFRRAVARAAESLESRTFYELLELPTDASAEEVRLSYHRLAKTYRPYDLYQEAETGLQALSDRVFAALSEAYETLLNPQARKIYDQTLFARPVVAEPAAAERPPFLAPDESLEAPAARVEDDLAAAEAEAEEAETWGEPPPEPAPEAHDWDRVRSGPAAPKSDAWDETPGEAPPAEFDFLGPPGPPPIAPAETPDIEWQVEADLAAGSSADGARELVDFKADADEAREVAEAGEVAASVADLIKSELAFQRGEDALHANRFADAQRHFEEALRLNPKEAEYCAFLGMATYLARPGDPAALARGRDLLERALIINPMQDSAYTFLGLLQLRDGQREQARRSFELALQYNPDNARARQELRKLESA